MPMQYTSMFAPSKMMKISLETFDLYFNTFAQNIDCGNTLDPTHRCGSNEYPQSRSWTKIKKTMMPLLIPVLLYKSGPRYKGVNIIWTCYHVGCVRG